jgi:hypothetical protein
VAGYGESVKGELRGLYSPDIPETDLESFRPEDGDNFALLVTAFVGPSDAPGEEMFDFVVCTPRWLAEHPAREDSGSCGITSSSRDGTTKFSNVPSAICALTPWAIRGRRWR